MSTGRIEAFSDGAFAIAITLLILEVHVPQQAEGHLWDALGGLWPSYAAYAVSFLTIGIIWVNHHAQFDRIVRADRALLFLNLLLLFWVSFIPFPTAVLAEYLRSDAGQRPAALFYVATMLAMGSSFFLLIAHHASRARLLDSSLTPAQVRAVIRRNVVGQAGYLVALGLALVSAPVCLAFCGAIALYYVHPGHLPAAPERPSGPSISLDH